MTKDNKLELNELNDDCYWNDRKISLTYLEYRILKLLLNSEGNLLIRKKFGGENIDTRMLDMAISRIRKKVPDITILTIRGEGYKLDLTQNEQKND